MSTATARQPSTASAGRGFPPLQNGDHLSRDEFERLYAEMPHGVKAELIEGVVYMAAALSAGAHGIPHLDFVTWLGTYRAATPGVLAADNSTVRLDLDNEPQPDVCMFIAPAHGGRVKFSPEGYIEGSPELVAEVAASSASIDLHKKLKAYQRNGVLEYTVFRTRDAALDWFVLKDGQFVLAAPDAQGIYHSTAFPGLWLDAAALISGRIADVLATLARGVESAPHVEFAKRLLKP